MTNRRFGLVLGAAAMVLAGIGGCTMDTPGVATTETPPSQSTSSTSSRTSTTRPPSTRPREVKVDGVNPCDLLSQGQLQQFSIDSPPRPDKDTTFQTPTCNFYSDSTRTGVRLTPVANVGIERFEPGAVTGDVKIRTIQGFPAREIHTPGSSAGNDFCTVVVDVADGQVLHTMFNEDGSKQPMSTEAVCQKANDAANAAMTTLLAR